MAGRSTKPCRIAEERDHASACAAPAWYLLARDIASGEARTFRMDPVIVLGVD